MMRRENGKNRLLWVFLVFVMVVAAEVWEFRVTSAAPSSKPITLRMMLAGEEGASNLSPITGGEGPFYNVMEPLIEMDKKGQSIPKLATKWEHSADLTKWRFYLRRGVKFHNGDNFTARDVVELVKWSLEEKRLSKLYPRVPAKEAVLVDDYTVDLIFENPQPLLLVTMRLFRIVPAAISKDNRKLAETHPIGTGPYRFVEWKRGLYTKFTKFENYWGPKPQIDDVVITYRGEEAVRLAALMAGEVDWVSELTPDQANRAPKVVHRPSPDTVWLMFEESIQEELGRVSILADKRLRLAIDYAIDRKALVALYSGFATPSLGQFASPSDFGFNPNLKSRPYDLEKAKALVREADAVGKSVSLVCASDRFSNGREVAEAVTYMIEKAGLKVKLMLMPHAEVRKYKSALGKDRHLKADVLISPSDTPLEVETRFEPVAVKGGNWTTTKDPEPTRLYKEIIAEIDPAKRGEKLAKAWAYVYEQAHYAPLFKFEAIWGLAPNLEWETVTADYAAFAPFAEMRFITR